MVSANDSHAKVEVKLHLHPQDHQRAMAAAKALNLAEREFFALALHLGATEILRQTKVAC